MKKVETDISFDELKAFILFETYSQHMNSLDITDEDIMRAINILSDYHFKKIYGKEYNQKKYDIDIEKFKCITNLINN